MFAEARIVVDHPCWPSVQRVHLRRSCDVHAFAHSVRWRWSRPVLDVLASVAPPLPTRRDTCVPARRLLANLAGLTAVACSNLFMGGPPTAGGAEPVPQADPSEVLVGVGLTILSQFIGERLGA